jgi:hypothetical protein
MVYVKIPDKTFVANDIDTKDYDDVVRILVRHGYALICFEHDNVVFYDKNFLSKDGFIPIAERYNMKRKSFAAFVGVLKKLDHADQKLCDMVVRLNTMRSHNVGPSETDSAYPKYP